MRGCRIAAWSITLFAAAGLLVTAGCGGDDPIAPPDIRAGRDECAECGMIINEERFAAAIIVDDRGRRTPLLFDDIGDLLEHERTNASMTILARFVHDHQTRAWIDATAASYVYSDALPTPMGFGMVALSTPSDARHFADGIGGRVIGGFEQALAFRTSWMKERFGSVDAPEHGTPR